MTTATAVTPMQSTSARPTHIAPPTLRVARFEDYSEIARLEASHELASFRVDDWRRLWLDNPL